VRTTHLCAAAILPLGLVAIAPPANAADGSPNRCEYSVQYQVFTRSPGYASTSAESYWVTGPGSITYTESEESSHAVGVNASVSMSASAIVAKAEATFGVDYTFTSSKTTSWGYNLSVPSGKTSRGLVLHRADKSGVKKVTYSATTCAVSRTDDGTAWYPINSTANSSYCIARDDSPAFSGWRATCAVT
jgi:hypothetical protein